MSPIGVHATHPTTSSCGPTYLTSLPPHPSSLSPPMHRLDPLSPSRRYLGLHLARLVIHVLHRDLLCKEDLLLTSSAKVREVEPWSGVAGLQVRHTTTTTTTTIRKPS